MAEQVEGTISFWEMPLTYIFNTVMGRGNKIPVTVEIDPSKETVSQQLSAGMSSGVKWALIIGGSVGIVLMFTKAGKKFLKV